MRRPLTFALVSVLLLAGATQVAAHTCNYTISNVNFGTVDILAGGAVDVTATLNVTCSSLLPVRACPSIGAGSGGADASARYMQGPSGPLAYQLYTNAARTTVWGSLYWAFGGTVPVININVILGTGSASATIFARVFGGQQTAATGSYLSNLTAADNVLDYALDTLILNCNVPLLQQKANTSSPSRPASPRTAASARRISISGRKGCWPPISTSWARSRLRARPAPLIRSPWTMVARGQVRRRGR